MSRLVEINQELKRLSAQRQTLLAERRQLLGDKRPKGPSEATQFWSGRVFSVIENHPGISREKLLSELGQDEALSEIPSQTYTNCIIMLRRRGAIENQGTRQKPKWYVRPNITPRDERLNGAGQFNVYGRCDTCGAPCDSKGCQRDPQHEIALP